MNKLLIGGSVAAIAASLWATSAMAATAAASGTASDETPSLIGEIVVVAQKREQSIETVPVAVTAFTSKEREVLGIQKFQDLTDFSPGLSWTDINDRIYIRGIGRNSDNLNNTSGVAIYYNGVYYGANAAIELQKDSLFIGNTEVDNGPQNTLHGSNADGGVVQFTSVHPTDTPYEEVRAQIANYSEYLIEGAVSGPINDHLKFRVAGNFTTEAGGFFNNLDGPPQGGNLVLGGSGQTHYLEAQLQGKWDHFDFWAQVSSGEFSANSKGAAVLGNVPDYPFSAAATLIPNPFYALCGLPGVVGSPNGVGCTNAAGNPSGPAIVPGSVRTEPFTANAFPGNNPGNVNPRLFIQEFNSLNDQQRNWQGTVNATYHFPSADLTYLGAYQQFHYVLEFPSGTDAGVLSFQEAGPAALGNLTIYPAPSYTLFNEYDQSFSHEINLTSTSASKFQYIGGLYWYHEHWNQPVYAQTMPDQPQLGAPEFLNGVGGTCAGGATLCAAPPNPSFAGSAENTEINYDSLAVFAQGSYKFSDQWKISGAVRYTTDHKQGWQEWRVVNFDSIITASTLGSLTPALDITALAAAPGKFAGTGTEFINPNTGYAERTLGATWSAFTGEADVDWTPDRTFLAYAKYSRGYKSGGWSTYTLSANPEVGPEFVDAFEIGAKKTIGSQWTLNGDAFYYNYYGEQVPLNVATITGPVGILYNVPLVHNYGVELWGTWHPIQPLVFTLSYSYLNAKVIQAACVEDTVDPLAVAPGAKTAGCTETAADIAGHTLVQNIQGAQIPGATPNKVSLNVNYTWDFDPGTLNLSGSLIWKDATYYNVFNRPYNQAPAYDQVNLVLNWADIKGRYNIILFCQNLFNNLGYDASGGLLLNSNYATAGEDIVTAPALTAPRTFGIQFQYRWK